MFQVLPFTDNQNQNSAIKAGELESHGSLSELEAEARPFFPLMVEMEVQKFQPVMVQWRCLVPSKVVALMRVMTGKKSRNALLIRVWNDASCRCCHQNTGKLFGKEEGRDFHEHNVCYGPR